MSLESMNGKCVSKRGDLLQQQEEGGHSITLDALIDRMEQVRKIAEHAETKVFTSEGAKIAEAEAKKAGVASMDFHGLSRYMAGRKDVATFVLKYLRLL